MTLTQMRHMKLWFAGAAKNWPLAAYELDELEEGFADASRFHPTHEKAPRPLAELISEFVAGPIGTLRSVVDRRDTAAFPAAFDALTQGCNACHAAAQFSFNAIVRPTENPYSDQRFSPPR